MCTISGRALQVIISLTCKLHGLYSDKELLGSKKVRHNDVFLKLMFIHLVGRSNL